MKKIILSIVACIAGLSIHLSSSDQAIIMKDLYNATPCANKKLIERFNQIQDSIGIKNKLPLYEVAQFMPSKYLRELNIADSFINYTSMVAFYEHGIKVVAINQPLSFSVMSQAVQDFYFYHELRHHLQNTTMEAYNCVQQYEKALDMTTCQALEYDADTFALQQIAKNNCPHCLQEIKSLKHVGNNVNTVHDSIGYLTSLAVDPYLKTAKENPSICHTHKSMSRLLRIYHSLSYYDISMMACGAIITSSVYKLGNIILKKSGLPVPDYMQSKKMYAFAALLGMGAHLGVEHYYAKIR